MTPDYESNDEATAGRLNVRYDAGFSDQPFVVVEGLSLFVCPECETVIVASDIPECPTCGSLHE